MNLEPAPRLPKWIFLAIDLGLLLIAYLIVSFARDPYAPLPFVSALLCAVLAAIIGLVPFLLDYAADSAEFVQRERERMAEQSTRVNASVESLSRAAAQIKAIEEAVHKSAREAETLPYRMQEKLAEFNEALAAKEETDREALETELEQLRSAQGEQLKGAADKIAKVTADWTALEAATRKQLAATEAALAKLHAAAAESATKADASAAATAAAAQAAALKLETQISAALQQLDARLADLKAATAAIPTTITVAAPLAAAAPTALAAAPVIAPAPAAPASEPEPAAAAPAAVVEPTPDATPAPAEVAASTESAAPEVAPATPESAADSPAVAVEAPKSKKPRAPRKPKTEDAPATPAADTAPAVEAAPVSEPAAAVEAPPPVAAAPVEPEPEPVAVAPAEPEPESDLGLAIEAPATRQESSSSSDGATRLLATAYIGIGNKLFIRGDGPGLSWDRGVPMQFVSIGKWGWFTHDASGPIRCKLYKNDETLALTGEVVLEAGRHTEVTAMF